jgi:hypothetical protein
MQLDKVVSPTLHGPGPQDFQRTVALWQHKKMGGKTDPRKSSKLVIIKNRSMSSEN